MNNKEKKVIGYTKNITDLELIEVTISQCSFPNDIEEKVDIFLPIGMTKKEESIYVRQIIDVFYIPYHLTRP